MGPSKPVLAQKARHRDEVVVVHPDGVARLDHLHQNCAGEQLIYRLIGLVMSLLVPEAFGEVVKERPERAVAITVVVLVDLVGRELDGRVVDVSVGHDVAVPGSPARRFALAAPPQPDATG